MLSLYREARGPVRGGRETTLAASDEETGGRPAIASRYTQVMDIGAEDFNMAPARFYRCRLSGSV